MTTIIKSTVSMIRKLQVANSAGRVELAIFKESAIGLSSAQPVVITVTVDDLLKALREEKLVNAGRKDEFLAILNDPNLSSRQKIEKLLELITGEKPFEFPTEFGSVISGRVSSGQRIKWVRISRYYWYSESGTQYATDSIRRDATNLKVEK